MTMDPATGEGFDAVEVGFEDYFDPNATDENFPGAQGLNIRKHTWWQGDVEFYTYDTLGAGSETTYVTVPPSEAGSGVSTPGSPISGSGGIVRGGVDTLPCYEEDGVTLAAPDQPLSNLEIILIGAYGGEIRFPVLPESLGASFSHEYWTPKVVGLGEVVLAGGEEMETIGWDSFFPSQYDSQYVTISPTDMESPKSLCERIIWTMRFKMDCMLVVGGSLWSDRVVITSFSYKHVAGEPNDIYYTIAFKRYRVPTITTSPNPDAMWDRWYKDPRQNAPTGSPNDPTTGVIPTDPNPNETPVVPDAPTPRGDDNQNPGVAGRNSLMTIEQTTVIESKNVLHNPYTPNEALIAAGLNPQTGPGETAQDVSERLSQQGPNDLLSLLALNPWIQDNGYNPYTTHLKIGEGIRYYKETPVTMPPKRNNQPVRYDPVTGAAVPQGELTPGPASPTRSASPTPTPSATPVPPGTTTIRAPWNDDTAPQPVPVTIPRETPSPSTTPTPTGTPGPR